MTSTDLPTVVERVLSGYQRHRTGPDESFQTFAGRHSVEQLIAMFAAG